MPTPLPRWAALAAIAAGLTWIPVRLGVSASWNTSVFRLTYVEWNQLMVVPLGLMLAVTLVLVRRAPIRTAALGAGIAAAGLAAMLAGVIVEFYVAGGLAGNRDGAVIGWMLYLLGGVLVHVVGLGVMGVALMRTDRWRSIGILALVIAALQVAWLPAGIIGTELLVADQVSIGIAWVVLGGSSVGLER